MGRISLKLNFDVFEDLAAQIDDLGLSLTDVISEALENVGEDIGVRTKEAVAKANLPAKGIYSQGDTSKTVVLNPQAEKNGIYVEIGIGFDKNQPGAGGFLITGTPKMQPVYELEDLYSRKKYQRECQNIIYDTLQNAINDHLSEFT